MDTACQAASRARGLLGEGVAGLQGCPEWSPRHWGGTKEEAWEGVVLPGATLPPGLQGRARQCGAHVPAYLVCLVPTCAPGA